jgi:ribosomal protein S12
MQFHSFARDLKLTCYPAKTKKILKENDDVLINKTQTLKHDQAVTFKLVSLHEILSDRDKKEINSEPRGCAT